MIFSLNKTIYSLNWPWGLFSLVFDIINCLTSDTWHMTPIIFSWFFAFLIFEGFLELVLGSVHAARFSVFIKRDFTDMVKQIPTFLQLMHSRTWTPNSFFYNLPTLLQTCCYKSNKQKLKLMHSSCFTLPCSLITLIQYTTSLKVN